MKNKKLHFDAHLPNLLHEVLGNPTCGILKIPINITCGILSELAQLAIKIDDPHLQPLRNWFDEQLCKRLDEFFAKRVKKVESDIYAWIKRNPICYMNPCEAILGGICGVITPAIYPHGNVLAERYDVSEFFLQFPRALPIELKGIAV